MIKHLEAMQNIGREVIYTPYHGAVKEGVITGVSGPWIMVRYGSDTLSKATAPAALDFIGGAS